MKPTHFYCHYTNGTQTKNKLQAEFDDFLRILDSQIYEKADIPKLKKYVDDVVKNLNEKHPRCKPLKVTLDKSWRNDKDYVIATEFGTVKLLGGEIHRM